jgi:hypothetical protein
VPLRKTIKPNKLNIGGLDVVKDLP